MKLRNILFFLLLAVTAGITFTGCKKYPEDDKRSWSTPKRRLDGDWSFSSFTINGVDSTLYYKCGDLVRFDGDNLIWFDGLFQCDKARWELTDDKETLKLQPTLLASRTKALFPAGEITHWNILQLTKKKMQLETVYNGYTYKISLASKD